ncbi:hypothetical protein [Paraflavitalea sp. CAU 1676]|uniref:hypothetical protein n=1 Tax=Paraflavitalea sp. CAU 1676 TaxID=3032598 RepID=UPI0023DBA2CD|nr:hypothetical protein [Paraflavitalea sp. CAU 1676]MDF2191686.1 hypothetical protein [Paraflavitalea sp. CAU 1676]
MGKRPRTRKRDLIILFLMIGFIIWGFINPFWRRKEIKEHARYSIGTVYKKTGSLKNGDHYHYTFQYAGETQEGTRSIYGIDSLKFGDRFIVEFSYRRPDVSKIHYEWPVYKEFSNAPDSGWIIIPRNVVVGY